MGPEAAGAMDTHEIKAEVEKNIEKLSALREEVRLKLHLASLDAKKEWDDKLAPRVHEVEQAAKSITESSRSTLSELVAKVEDFLVHLHPSHKDKGEKS
jgi:hypothetical protein